MWAFVKVGFESTWYRLKTEFFAQKFLNTLYEVWIYLKTENIECC